MIKIDTKLVEQLLEKANNSERKRANYNFHDSEDDTLQRMLNCLNVGTYIAPHKHEDPDKREAFIILRGKILIITFTETGKVTNHTLLEEGSGNVGAEIPPRTYHTLIPLTSGSVLYEIKDGPWDINTDKVFAPWAPKEGDEEALTYNENLLKGLDFNN
ncbi:WbuC family cupin fold metalloprotein [Chondrinema litorale]|uniref:WbuC family cupin fold metalloprotein n=1 Tax=Chondrinema litorale TaxID=2994555 RepID=UPI002543E7F9|nr:WbuC family cupin fold metalloprotein [Chondrinema litorale]UZR96020.1 WbuC family cupin fold metalloprotein [Chondrinema litorale]